MIHPALITMTDEESRRYEIIKDLEKRKIDGTEASKKLNLSVRQTKRLKAQVKKRGIKGIIHGNRGRVSHNKTATKLLVKVKEYLNERYSDFNPLLAQEKLAELHSIELSKETVRQIMIEEKLWRPRKKGQIKKHFWRERKDNYGEMEQFDGSYHNWFEGRNKENIGLEQCLLLSVDDATGKITGAAFDYHEGIVPVFTFWRDYFKDTGLPASIYLDKFSTYKVNHANAVDNQEFMTQFERAMNQLGVRVIHANSPQAKGRVEKMNGTLQRRLIKEMRLSKINTIKEANEFINKIFIPKFNKQFAVAPKKEHDLHQKLNNHIANSLDQILSVQTERVINNDYTVRFKNLYCQLKETQPITVYKKDKVIVEEHLNGELKISIRNHYLEYTHLPERPKKEIDIQLTAITRIKQTAWKPPADHPWRRAFLLEKQPLTAVRN